MTWKTTTLADACEFRNGLWKGEKAPFVNVGVLRNTNFTKEGMLDDSDVARIDVEERKFEKRRLKFGDIILEKSGGGPKQAVGRVAFFDKRDGLFSFSNFTAAIRVKDPKVLDCRYLHRYLHWIYVSGVTETMQSHSTGIRNLDGDKYKALDIRFPALSEQHRIVAILDEAFAGIATVKANAEKGRQRAYEIFANGREELLSGGDGWLSKPLSSLCSIKHGFAFDGAFFASKGRYVLLTPGNFFEEGGYRDRGEKQKFFVGQIPPDYVLAEGALLVAMTEQAAGLLGSPILTPESDRFLHNQRLGLVVAHAGVPWNSQFFFHVFNMRRVRDEIHASSSGVKVRHTSPTKIGNVVVSFPAEVREQRRIASALASLQGEAERLASIYARKIAALDELKQSLLQRAFAGEL